MLLLAVVRVGLGRVSGGSRGLRRSGGGQAPGHGESRVSVVSSGPQLCVIRCQAQRSVLLELSNAFPSACRVA
ncbi:hypothetical protein [Acaryochloris sp. CCMEE 5410]|uniref:hypothetical protein n=1 Tax=Acaryochloris sp. CCMEE 5410 TaxID=310037 RepID=UPI0021CE492B|nr:hypothetical protein [Acaryochloris sp. CCMEE 5410]